MHCCCTQHWDLSWLLMRLFTAPGGESLRGAFHAGSKHCIKALSALMLHFIESSGLIDCTIDA